PGRSDSRSTDGKRGPAANFARVFRRQHCSRNREPIPGFVTAMIEGELKVLLVGPYPPPHGGISIHVWNARAILRRQGVPCEVLNIEPRAPESDQYIKISGSTGLAVHLARYCANGWTVHTHINGHTPKSWLIALASGMAGQIGAGGVLTIHSGLSPEYLRNASSHRRRFALLAALQFNRIVCVNEEI